MKRIRHNTPTIEQVIEIVEGHGLTLTEFTTYQRAMPQKRALIHKATLDIFEKLQPSEPTLSKLLGINRSKVRRMRQGEDVDQLPAHYSQDEISVLREMLMNGQGYGAISDVLQRSPCAIKDMASKNGATMKKVNPDLYQQRVTSGWGLRKQF